MSCSFHCTQKLECALELKPVHASLQLFNQFTPSKPFATVIMMRYTLRSPFSCAWVIQLEWHMQCMSQRLFQKVLSGFGGLIHSEGRDAAE